MHATHERNDLSKLSPNAAPEQMQAIVQDTYGSADVLELRTIDHPEIAANEVLIEVHAAGVDRGVWHLMTGEPYLIRIAGFGVLKPKNPVLGLDVAGRVVAIGLAFDCQQVEAVPHGPSDYRLDWVLTPSGPRKTGS